MFCTFVFSGSDFLFKSILTHCDNRLFIFKKFENLEILALKLHLKYNFPLIFVLHHSGLEKLSTALYFMCLWWDLEDFFPFCLQLSVFYWPPITVDEAWLLMSLLSEKAKRTSFFPVKRKREQLIILDSKLLRYLILIRYVKLGTYWLFLKMDDM